MRINEVVKINVTTTGGIAIEQSMSDDMILLNLLIAKRDALRSEDNNELASKVQGLIRELF